MKYRFLLAFFTGGYFATYASYRLGILETLIITGVGLLVSTIKVLFFNEEEN